MIIHKIENLWNFNRFQIAKFLKISIFQNGTISEI